MEQDLQYGLPKATCCLLSTSLWRFSALGPVRGEGEGECDLRSHRTTSQFQAQHCECPAESSRSYIGKTFVAVLGEDSVQDVKAAANSVVVDNEIVEWDCQDYVLEVLDKLEDEFVLNGDDEDYLLRRVLLWLGLLFLVTKPVSCTLIHG